MKIKSLGLLVLTACPLMAQGLFKASALGYSQGLLYPGASAGKVKTISASSGDAGIGPGKIENGVNLLTGQPYYSIPLGSITARTVGYPIVLTYSGGTKSTVDQDNERAPTSWVGLGFNLTFPFVATNHKGTYTSSDDVIFCNLGPYGGGQILLDSAGTRYYVSSNPYIKVGYDTASTGEYANQFTKWVFTFPDGKKMVFGQDTNAQRYVLYNKGIIKSSPYNYITSKKFIYRWDLSTFYDSIPNRPPKNILTFEYDRTLDSSAPQKSYVREGYVKSIRWVENNQEVEKYEFKTVPKVDSEYVGYGSSEPRNDQRLFETRRLDTLTCFKEGALTHFFKFEWTSQKIGPQKKGLLSKLKVFHPHPVTGTPVQDSGWTFTYDSGRFFLLNTLTNPSSLKDSLEYTQYHFWGSDGDQDPADYVMRRADNVSEIPLPADTADLAKWKAESTCDERFCYAVVWDGDSKYLSGDTVPQGYGIRYKMYVEIKRNLGNYFDSRSTDNGDTVTARFEVGDAWTPANKWKFVPAGNYVLVVGEHFGTVALYEYDGVKWTSQSVFNGDPHLTNGNFGSEIKVFAAANYFIVQTVSTPSKIILAFRKKDGWTSLNRNSAHCDFTNKDDYGESIRSSQSSGDCMEWSRTSLIINAMPLLFTVVDTAKSVICAYALKQDGDGFEEISRKFGDVTNPSGIQVSGKPMNWSNQIEAIYPSSDYFLVYSRNGAQPLNIHGFYFNGDSLRVVYEDYSTEPGFLLAFPSEDYFILVAPGLSHYNLRFMKKVQSSGGYFWFGPGGEIRDDFNPAWRLQVRTHPSSFSVEYYPDSASVGLRPKWVSNSQGKYHSYLYQVSPYSYSPYFMERSSEMDPLNRNLYYNFSFSGSDNVLIATHGRTMSGSLCGENINASGCIIDQFTARYHPRDTSSFIHGAADDKKIVTFNSTWQAKKQSQSVMSNAARLGMWLIMDSTGSSRRIRYRHYQYDGKGFASPDSQFVVDRVSSLSTLGNEDKNKVAHQFYYTPYSMATAEFNSNLQIPQFEVSDVARVKTDFTELGSHRSAFNLDAQATPLSGKSGSMIGMERYSRTMAGNGDTTLYMKSLSEPYRHPAWPKPLYLPRQKAIYSQSAARNLSRMTDTTTFYNYCDTNGLPHFTLQKSGLEKIILSQSYFDALGFLKQSAVYRLFSPPVSAVLETLNPSTPYSYSGLIAGSKVRYQGYYFQEDSLWSEADQNLSNADLKAGTTPTFRLDEGWLPGTQITQRDTANFFQVLETKVVKNKLAGGAGERHTSFFYEGLRSDPVSSVSNARLANCAILMGENGNTDLGGLLDHRGRWEAPGAVLSPSRVHTGRFSIKVTDNYGPTVNLYLKDVRERRLSFHVSAWIYSETDVPMMVVERRQSNGSYVNAHYGIPVTGSSGSTGLWQRWEANLTYDQLTAGGLFNGNNDYLRIWIGTGAPAGNGTKILYVDDIVCLPGSATFSLQTYDARGMVTSVTDATHRSLYYNIGFKGQVMAIRDEKSRIFGQRAVHRMGEN